MDVSACDSWGAWDIDSLEKLSSNFNFLEITIWWLWIIYFVYTILNINKILNIGSIILSHTANWAEDSLKVPLEVVPQRTVAVRSEEGT